MNAALREVMEDVRGGLCDVRQAFRRYGMVYLACAVTVVALVWAIWPYDKAISDTLTANRPKNLVHLARGWRQWSAFFDTLVFTLGLYAAGWIWRRRTWRRAAMCAFLAATLSGLSANVIRVTTGRPRPRANQTDVFTGLALTDYAHQSFPSGHMSTSAGCAVGLAVACPPLGAVAILNPAGVAWSSFYTRNHYVTDLLTALALALAWGLPVGLGAVRRNQPRPDVPPTS